MNIFLEAFVDTNFGDNLFVHTVVRRYPQHTFYMLPKSGYEASYDILLKEENNICLINSSQEPDFIRNMDAMMVVGGDMIWEGTYLTWLSYIRNIKKRKGKIIFMGMSLFPRYSRKTRFFLRRLFHQTDVIVVRESTSCNQIKQLAPKANVIAATDMAFTIDVEAVLSEQEETGVLGISVRKKIPRETADTYKQYCQCMANTAICHLKKAETNAVRFLALSKGVFDDGAVAWEIIRSCPTDYQPRMSVVSFEGSVEGYIREMQKCETMLCTRFHALVFAILLKKPFVPVVYEEKMRRLLSEIGYQGISLCYEEEWDGIEALRGLERSDCSKDRLEQYLDKAKTFFSSADIMLKYDDNQKK